MADLTLLLATSNRIDKNTAKKIRDYVIEVTKNQYPIISVSQEPIDFGTNICVGDIGHSKYNEYKQILIGTREVKTKYVATIDDDALYSPEHFYSRPPDGFFIYETNYWLAQDEKDHYWRVAEVGKRGGMWGCISTTQTMLKNLERRFKMFPQNPFLDDYVGPKPLWWGEPAIHDEEFGGNDDYIRVYSKNPCVIFIHSASMGYNQLRKFHRRYGFPKPENVTTTLEQFGTIEDLRNKYWTK